MSSEALEREVVASVRGLGKCFHVYSRPIDRLKQALWRGRRRFYLEFWALRDVSFELHGGEALGIVGRNGAGKSTLLQILAGTLEPSEGEIRVHRRVAALLELGSGFNPEFTGRENILLNGIILGLAEDDIRARFDEIEKFADIGSFIDQPIRNYSTGMVMRLAFAVQVLMEPEILIVDEALAVGDAAFQVKCMRHMRGLVERGVSVLLVTHDIHAVRIFCDRVLWLEGGRQAAIGEPLEVTNRYMARLVGAKRESPRPRSTEEAQGAEGGEPAESGVERDLCDLTGRADLVRWGQGWAVMEAVGIRGGSERSRFVLEHGDRILVDAEVQLRESCSDRNLGVAFSIRNTKGLDIICYTTWEAGVRFEATEPGDRFHLSFELENILAPGDYVLTIAIEDVQGEQRLYGDYLENAALIKVVSFRPIFSNVLPAVRHQIRRVASRTASAR